MPATVAWGILPAPLATKTKPGWWQLPVPTWVTIIGAIVAFAVGAYSMYKAVASDMPKVMEGIADIQKKLSAHDVHLQQERASRTRADSAIRILQTNVVALIQKVERRKLRADELREIMVNVQEVSKAEVAQLSPPTVTGEQPETPPAGVIAHAPADFAATLSTAYKANAPEGLFAKAMMAKNSKWQAADTGIIVTYDGGSAFFPAKPGTTASDLRKKAELFNSFAHAWESISSGDISTQMIKKPIAPQESPAPRGGTPETRAPNLQPQPDSPQPLPNIK